DGVCLRKVAGAGYQIRPRRGGEGAARGAPARASDQPAAPLNSGTASTAAIDISLMRMLIDGPAVSLNGSPTVSPITVALCTSDPLPPWWPASTYFLALSHEPPALAMNRAIITPEPSAPASRPPT